MTIGDLIYVKKCLGQEGKSIDIYKIRTMYLNADERLEELVSNGFDSFGKLNGDPRITPIGRFLRRYWIDELPQLYNLARGEIKLVGIRPRSEVDWKRYPDEIIKRALRQKPGLMAIEYAFNRTNSFNDQLENEKEYLNRWEENHDKTDKEYFFQIVRNIVFGGIRSS